MVKKTTWNGFVRLDFMFEDREAIVILPEKPNGNWMLKTEYFDAFPAFEIEMVKRGWHLAYLQNKTRWVHPDDVDAKARFADHLKNEFGLTKRCLPVGMSCGGMHAVYFAAKYPQYIAALYLDAPVMNLLSCPGDMGIANCGMLEEFMQQTGMSLSELICYRNHPIDVADRLIEAKLPVFLVCGDSDTVVPYRENGELLYKKYQNAGGELTLVLKPGCDHHPHGLEDLTPLIEFAQKHA